MPEDKLSHAERLRLECLAQAIAFDAAAHAGVIARRIDAAEIIDIAKVFEEYVGDSQL